MIELPEPIGYYYKDATVASFEDGYCGELYQQNEVGTDPLYTATQMRDYAARVCAERDAEMESAEPVAWRVRFGESTSWTVYEYQPTQSMFGTNIDVQPLYAQPKAEPAQEPLNEIQRMDIVTTWFTDDADITLAMQMLTDFEQTTNAEPKVKAEPLDEFDHPEHCWKWTKAEVDFVNKRVADAVAKAVQQKAEPVQEPKQSAIDFLPHDDNLRFVQRVLESDAPRSDRDDAAQMVRDMRRSIYRAAAPQAKPLTSSQIATLWADDIHGSFLDFARAVEAAHGIGDKT